MRTAVRVRCSGCGADWRSGSARFCGACGDRIADSRRPDDGRGVPTMRRNGPPLKIVALVAVAAVVAAAGVVVGAVGGPVASPDAGAVALPERDEVMGRGDPEQAGAVEGASPPLADEEPVVGATGRAVVGPPRCTPAGCERWRRRLPTPTSNIASGPGLVVALVGEQLHAIDADTGVLRWVARLRGPVSDGTRSVAFDAPIGLAVGAELIAVSGGAGWIQLRDAADGSVRWSVRHDGPVTDVALAAGTVIARQGGGSLQTITALAVADGRPLWRREADAVIAIEEEQVLVRDGAVTRALDPATGAVRFETNGRADPLGPWLAVDDNTSTRLIDPKDGTPLTVLRGVVYGGPVHAEGRWVVVLAVPPRPWATGFEPRVLGLSDDAALVWERPLEAQARECCPALPFGDGRVLVQGARSAQVLDGVDGEPGALEPLRLDPGGRMVAGALWATQDGQAVTIRAATSAGWIRVEGASKLVSEAPLVVTDGRELVGLERPGR